MTLTAHERYLYRMARREGYPPPAAYYAARPAVLELDPDPYADAFDAGSFTWQGAPFWYRVEWDDYCLCREDSERPDDWDEWEHLSVTVGAVGTDEVESLSSVCGDERTTIRRRSAEHYRADVMLDLAREILRVRLGDQLTIPLSSGS